MQHLSELSEVVLELVLLGEGVQVPHEDTAHDLAFRVADFHLWFLHGGKITVIATFSAIAAGSAASGHGGATAESHVVHSHTAATAHHVHVVHHVHASHTSHGGHVAARHVTTVAADGTKATAAAVTAVRVRTILVLHCFLDLELTASHQVNLREYNLNTIDLYIFVFPLLL